MLSEKLNNELNIQINKEFHSAYLYLSISKYFIENGLYGFGHWCKKQAQEEVEHGMLIFNFLLETNEKIDLMQIMPPENNFKNAIETVKEILVHEKHITDFIKNINNLAHEENAFTTQNLLEKMLEEQIEEEAQAYEIYSKMKLFGDCKSALYILDKELSQRQ